MTRSACCTGLAHTFLTISNINEVVLAVNSQHVACKLKGNYTRATPPNLLVSRSDWNMGACTMKDGATFLNHISFMDFFFIELSKSQSFQITLPHT